MPQSKPFSLIEVHADEDELVVRAGSGVSADAHLRDAAISHEPADGGGSAQGGRVAQGAAAETAAGNAAHEDLLRRARELERAEAGLANPKPHARMHRAVIAGLVALVALVVLLSVFHLG